MGRIVTLPQSKTCFTNRALYTSNTSFYSDSTIGTNLVKITVVGQGANGTLDSSGAAGGWAQRITQLTNGSFQCLIISCGTSTNTCFGGFIYATSGCLAMSPGCGVGGAFNYCGGCGACGTFCTTNNNHTQCHYTPHHPTQHPSHTWCGLYCGNGYGGGGAPSFCGNGLNSTSATGCGGGFGSGCCRLTNAFYTGGQHNNSHGQVATHNHHSVLGYATIIPSLNYDVSCSVLATKCAYPILVPSCYLCGAWGCYSTSATGICVVDACTLLTTLTVSSNPYAFCSCYTQGFTLCIMGGQCPYQLYYGHPGGHGCYNCANSTNVHYNHHDYHTNNCNTHTCHQPNHGHRNGCYGSGGAGGMCGKYLGCSHHDVHGNHSGCTMGTPSSQALNSGGCGGQGAIFVEW